MHKRVVVAGWAAFALANVGCLLGWSVWETIPVLFVWIGLTCLDVTGPGPGGASATTILFASLVTGIAFVESFQLDDDADSIAGAPIVAAMLLGLAWYVYRREAEQSGVREFLRTTSHALRTPITIATGHVELLLLDRRSDEDRVNLEVVLDELGRLEQLSEEIMTLSAAGHPDFLRLTPVRVESLLDELGRRWSTAVPRRWAFETNKQGFVYADPHYLTAALDALIENAVDFTGEEDDVSVVTTGDGRDVVITVSDTGPGMAPGHLPRIFEPFFRVSAESNPGRAGGTGLGLAIVKALAEAQGGSVSVQSEPGRGTSFELRLPWWIPGSDRSAPRSRAAPIRRFRRRTLRRARTGTA